MILIDAEKAIDCTVCVVNDYCRTGIFKNCKCIVENIFDSQPTAYNVERVCEELCELFECSDECKSKFYYGLGCDACMWGDVLNIVKRGGINE